MCRFLRVCWYLGGEEEAEEEGNEVYTRRSIFDISHASKAKYIEAGRLMIDDEEVNSLKHKSIANFV